MSARLWPIGGRYNLPMNWTEAAGTVCAIVSLARGALTNGDKAVLVGCLLLFAFTAYVGLLMPRGIHN